ncbi:putative Ent-kaurene oxidase [Diaporthe sp. PMI_573]|nr:putative Ent-kaurene oxidase [Diaporthaceae sp. PMI_573]
MARKDVGRLAAATGNEINLAFRDIWGADRGWKTVTGWDMCGRIISRASQRILIGMPLSRNETLLEISRHYATSMLVGGAIMNCFPPFLRRLTGPVIALRAKYYQARFVKTLIPMVEDRIRMWEAGKADVPDDFLQWMIPILAKEGNEQIDASRITLRLVSMLIPLIYAMCYVFSHCVFDINGSKNRADVLTGLEEECSRVVSKHGGLDSPEAIHDLHRIDSALRESMRVSDVAVTNVFRDVTAGVLDIGSNVRVGPGVRMVLPTQDIHLDPDNYAEPWRFDAFRFSRPFEQGCADGERQTMTKETLTFLPWGYGRHTCPGRWFVSQTVKQALGYLILNYDIELIGKPIRRRALLNTMVPPVEARFRFRQKEDVICI